MKRILSTAGWLVVAAALTIGMTACSGSEDIADSQQIPAGEAAPKTYTMTIEASKGGGAQARATRSGGTVMCATWADGSDEAMTEQACGATRALGLSDNGNTLNASWTVGDVVKVLKVGATSYPNPTVYFDLGTLAAVNVSDETCTLMGTLDSDKISQYGLVAGDNLVLVSPGNKAGSGGSITLTYTGQDGTLAKIASDYDYCMTSMNGVAMVSVASVDNGNITTTGMATFAPQQAIVRFTLVDEVDHPIVANSLTISSLSLQPTAYLTSSDAPVSGNSLTLTNGNQSNVFYAALRGVSGNGKVTLTATGSGGFSYTYQTNNKVTFNNGKFYDIKVKMKSQFDLVNLSGLTGPYTAKSGDMLSGMTSQTVTIASGATVALKDAIISGGIVCSGNADIILIGSNNVTSPENMAGIQAADGCTLTISGSGSLYALGGDGAAGIGSGDSGTCGDITISGGTVTATGGTVTATGRAGAAGIGSGFNATCGNINIKGGTVTATGGAGAAGIGSGNYGICGAITIENTVSEVTATKGSDAPYSIGPGNEGTCGTVTIGGPETEFISTSPYTYEP